MYNAKISANNVNIIALPAKFSLAVTELHLNFENKNDVETKVKFILL